jgi:hypothetical protein
MVAKNSRRLNFFRRTAVARHVPLEDYLMPGEEIKFQSTGGVKYGEKLYHVILTDRRILLYAQRGMIVKNDDVVTQKLDELQGIKYSEEGIIGRRGTIHIEGRTKMDLHGAAAEIKVLYQQMMQFM